MGGSSYIPNDRCIVALNVQLPQLKQIILWIRLQFLFWQKNWELQIFFPKGQRNLTLLSSKRPHVMWWKATINRLLMATLPASVYKITCNAWSFDYPLSNVQHHYWLIWHSPLYILLWSPPRSLLNPQLFVVDPLNLGRCPRAFFE